MITDTCGVSGGSGSVISADGRSKEEVEFINVRHTAEAVPDVSEQSWCSTRLFYTIWYYRAHCGLVDFIN